MPYRSVNVDGWSDGRHRDGRRKLATSEMIVMKISWVRYG